MKNVVKYKTRKQNLHCTRAEDDIRRARGHKITVKDIVGAAVQGWTHLIHMNNSSSLVFKDKEKLLLITDFKRVVKILIHLSKKITNI